MSKDTFESYWIGKGIDYHEIWHNYEIGDAYKHEFQAMPVHILRIQFDYPPSNLPLFNFDAVYKTIKGTFHDIKKICFNENEYNKLGTLYLYDVDRSSFIIELLGPLVPIVLWSWWLKDDVKFKYFIENKDSAFSILKKHFPDPSYEELEIINKTKNSDELTKAISEINYARIKLRDQEIKNIQISTKTINGSLKKGKESLVNIDELQEKNKKEKF